VAEFPKPTPAEVSNAMRQVPSPQLRRVFFEGLNNPHWVIPLLEAGQFGSPPEPTVDTEGSVREKPWPEIDYLVRMAPLVPDDVIRVFITIKSSANSWVRRSIVAVGASLPPEKAPMLKPVLESWEESGFGYRTDPRDLAVLTRNLLRGPKPEVGRRLARAVFGPRGTDAKGRPVLGIDDYWYEQELPGIAEALGDKALPQLVRWLRDWESLSGKLADGSDYNPISRPMIETRTRGYSDVEDALIDVVRDAAIKEMAREPQGAVATLLRGGMSLTRRILLFAAARAMTTGSVEVAKKVLEATIGVLDDPAFANPAFRLELAEYFRAIAAVSDERMEVLSAFLERGPLGDRDALISRLRREGESDETVEERASDFAARWRHRLLAAIGSPALPESLKLRLQELNAQEGEIETPTAPDFRVTTGTGPNSPLTLDELSSMTPAELVDHLLSWHPPADSWIGPSHEGQGRELAALVTAAPRATSGQTDLVVRLRPLYLRSIIEGWEAALQGQLELDWRQVLDVIRYVATHDDASPFEAEGGDFDDDATFKPARHAAIGFIEEATKKRSGDLPPAEIVDELGRILLNIARDGRAWSQYIGGDYGDSTDPLTLSINATWPIQARAIVNLAGFTSDQDLRAAALDQLDAELNREDPFDALSAVVGESLPRLYLSNQDWLLPRVPRLFGTAQSISRKQQIALSTALATQYIHSVTLEILRGAALAAMRLDSPIAVGWHGSREPEQLMGEWIITTYVRGELPIDDELMITFFRDEPAEIRGDAIGHVAWTFMQAEEVDSEIRERLEILWDERVSHVRAHPGDKAEIKDFYWFIRSRKFEPAWWVPRLLAALEIDPDLQTHGMIDEDLAAAAPDFPRQVLQAVIALASAHGGGMYGFYELAVPAALAWALTGDDDDDLVQQARRFMNELAERGDIHIESRVRRVDTFRPPRAS